MAKDEEHLGSIVPMTEMSRYLMALGPVQESSHFSPPGTTQYQMICQMIGAQVIRPSPCCPHPTHPLESNNKSQIEMLDYCIAAREGTA